MLEEKKPFHRFKDSITCDRQKIKKLLKEYVTGDLFIHHVTRSLSIDWLPGTQVRIDELIKFYLEEHKRDLNIDIYPLRNVGELTDLGELVQLARTNLDNKSFKYYHHIGPARITVTNSLEELKEIASRAEPSGEQEKLKHIEKAYALLSGETALKYVYIRYLERGEAPEKIPNPYYILLRLDPYMNYGFYMTEIKKLYIDILEKEGYSLEKRDSVYYFV